MEQQIKYYALQPKPIGIGHYGTVYEAFDSLKEQTVAIKKIRAYDGEKEAFILKEAGKGNGFLPIFHDFFVIDEYGYVVMELLDGKKLGAGFHDKIKQWDEKKAVQTAINILTGISSIHELGYIHNDIMPKNIMVKEYRPELTKVYDFNRAKEIRNEGMVLKDLRNTAEVCFVMLNGMLPKVLTGADLENKELESVLLKAIKPTDENKYHSTKEFIDALRPFS
ncbi:protein kinase [Aciduricibacillus chroicocephali]|uniref:Protein kinase n=1 Tax=Aciduricibacillus chroicocephali TaxID=3054939 RepID=A0ABY9KWY6_9BACI|nr:protein kinase [Bacillaceae bacterium 44XB]